MRLQLRDESVKVPVAGVYRDLSQQRPSEFWCSQSNLIYPLSAFANFTPPPLVLADKDTAEQLGDKLGETSAQISWEFPLESKDLSLQDAQDLAGHLRSPVLGGGAQSFGIGQIVGLYVIRQRTEFPGVVDRANATTTSVRGSVDTVSLAGRIVALLVIAAAGIYWVDRRRTEVSMLAARGVGPISVGIKVLLEVVLIAAVAARLGLWAAEWLVRGLGPTSLVDASASGAALRQVVLTVLASIALMAVVAGFSTRREGETGAGRSRSLARFPWETVVLALAAAAFYEIRTRGTAPVLNSNAPARVDALLLLFPILFVAGTAGLASRIVGRILPRLRTAGKHWQVPLYLASRRLAGAPRIVLALMTATALSVGILAYAGALTASVHATSDAKGQVFIGSDVSVTLATASSPIPASLRGKATRVLRFTGAQFRPGSVSVDVIGIDRATFEQTAFWDSSFSGRSLAALLSSLAPEEPGQPVPVLNVGASIPESGSLLIAGSTRNEIPIKVAASPVAFPGLHAGDPLLVIDRTALAGIQAPHEDQIWAKGDERAILAAFHGANVPTVAEVTAGRVGANPEFRSLTWTFGYLQWLGVVTGLIVLGGLLLYMESRQRASEVSYALARRMGLRRRANRRSIALELGSILIAGFVVGTAMAWLAARLVYRRLDPLPKLPPAALFRLPLLMLAVAAVVLVAVSWLGAFRIQRAADRADVAEVLRLAR